MVIAPEAAQATSGATDPAVIHGSITITPPAASARSYVTLDAAAQTRRLTLRRRRRLTVQPYR